MKITTLALLVAATPQTRATINGAFRSNEFEVLWTANPSEALETGARHHIDVMLLDLKEPLPAAWSTFERLTALNSAAPVVLLTDQKSKFEQAVLERMGAALQKPLPAAALVDTVNALFKTPAAAPAADGTREVAPLDMIAEAERFRPELQVRYSTPYTPEIVRRTTEKYREALARLTGIQPAGDGPRMQNLPESITAC